MNPLDWATAIAIFVYSVAVILALVRVIIGPTLPNRAMAVDLVASIVIGIMAVASIAGHQEVYLEMIIIWAILSFLSTVAFVNYLERREKD